MQQHLMRRILNISRDEQRALLRQVLSKAAKVYVSLTGPSMAASIASGATVLVQRIQDQQPLKLGKIYLFEADGGQVYAHRLIEIVTDEFGESSYIFKGDELTLADLPVQRTSILGLITHVVYPLGRRTLNLPLNLPGMNRMQKWVHQLRPWIRLIVRKALT